jgi:hypothetical protein
MGEEYQPALAPGKGETLMTHDVTYVIESIHGPGRFGLNNFTRDCPTTMHNVTKRQAKDADEKGYRVIAMITGPHDKQEEPSVEETSDERISYSVPAECRGWLDRFFERQGYGIIPGDPDAMEFDCIVVTKDERDAHEAAALEAEISALPQDDEEENDGPVEPTA